MRTKGEPYARSLAAALHHKALAAEISVPLLLSSIYRQSKLGDSLVEALDVLIKDGKVTPDLAYKILGEAALNALVNKIHARATFRGHLDTYRFCDNVWTFVLSNASFKASHSVVYTPDIAVDKIKIVCVDSRFVEAGGQGPSVKPEPEAS